MFELFHAHNSEDKCIKRHVALIQYQKTVDLLLPFSCSMVRISCAYHGENDRQWQTVTSVDENE